MSSSDPLPVLATERLVLRPWKEADLAPFAAMNLDPRVTEFFPLPQLTPEETAAWVQRMRRHFDEHGFGLWAVEVPGVVGFAGYVGLSVPVSPLPFSPCVEVGWRLAAAYWGRGYATEGARAALGFGFRGPPRLAEIVSFTVPANVRSRAVMERLGMNRSPEDDFDHPRIPPGHPLRRHVLYRLSRERYLAQPERHAGGAGTGS